MANNDARWITEEGLPYSEQDVKISYKIDKVVFDQKSPYGHIQIFDTPFFGRILVIDGIINIADRTEFIYHEMMVNLPAIRHGNPRSVLIMGGADGGAARRAVNIKSVDRVVQVEIDKLVIDACQQHMPTLADGALDNKKVELIIGDAIEYAQKTTEKFDVIVLDVSDPVPGGPAEHILSKEFYRNVKNLLTPDGVLLTHCGSLIFQDKKANHIVKSLNQLFNSVTLHVALIPEFELTEFGFLVCTNNQEIPDHGTIQRRFNQLLEEKPQYLTAEVYQSSKTLSPYIQKLTGIVNKP